MQKPNFQIFILLFGFLLIQTLFAENLPTFTVQSQHKSQNQSQLTLDQHPQAKLFIQEMSKKYPQLSTQVLTQLFSQVKSNPKVIELMDKPFEAKPWHEYRDRILSQERIQQGVAFWRAQKTILTKAEQTFGVPAEIIVAILGIETFYGKDSGRFSVLETLATLAFDYPRRAAFFKKELEAYLLLTQEEKLDPLAMKGSYAGAIGPGQFMPSSYRAYGIDFTKNGHSHLNQHMGNSIGSIAHYFKKQGWQAGQPVAYCAKISGNRYQQLQQKDKKNPRPSFTLAKLAQHGVDLEDAQVAKDIPKEISVALIELENKLSKEHWLTCHNFYVITRYNQSTHYAMAVHQLSESLKKALNPSLN